MQIRELMTVLFRLGSKTFPVSQCNYAILCTCFLLPLVFFLLLYECVWCFIIIDTALCIYFARNCNSGRSRRKCAVYTIRSERNENPTATINKTFHDKLHILFMPVMTPCTHKKQRNANFWLRKEKKQLNRNIVSISLGWYKMRSSQITDAH